MHSAPPSGGTRAGERKGRASDLRTGSGKKLAVTEDAMQRGAALLMTAKEEGVDAESEIRSQPMDLEIAKPVFGDGSSAASIFSTGLGNTVAVSDESMRKGAALFWTK